MLAKALPSVLPPLTREEMLEVTHLHSLAGNEFEKIITERPFRSPHHSSSHVALVGGGSRLHPGEISLSHRGVLFLDELPEFDRDTLEALRQPLEDRIISLARARDNAQFPANFILIATANPCPCGYAGSGQTCDCSSGEINRYQSRLSGPILDRIDLHCGVHEVDHDRLLTRSANPETDKSFRERIIQARQRQARRYGSRSKLNVDMTNQDVKRYSHLQPAAKVLLNFMARKHNLSARAYFRTLKVARTIADLEATTQITEDHISEALNYRPRPLKDNL